MWSDNESKVDLLRFSYLSSAVQRIVTSPDLLPTTVGLFGDWGSGKSTLIKLLEAELAGKPGTLCLSFNGWLFEGYEDARTALMGSILDGIKAHLEQNKGLFGKTEELLKKLGKRINWLQLLVTAGKYGIPILAGLPHLTVAAAATDAVAAIRGGLAKLPEGAKDIDVDKIKAFLKDAPPEPEEIRKTIREFRVEFAELIESSKLDRLVIFIDDLDRCLPNTIIETLEAIRLFLFVPKTAFVLGADERLVEYAVRKRFPELPGSRVEVGRDYLEKMVQIPIRIPSLSSAEMESYMNLLFADKRLNRDNYKIICDHVSNFKTTEFNQKSFDLVCARKLLNGNISSELQSDLDLVAQIAPTLTGGLGGSPRRTKRFLNTLILRIEMGQLRGLDLSTAIMAKLMLLEYIKPEFFKDLARLQGSQSGRPRELKELEGDLNKAETELTKTTGSGTANKTSAPEKTATPKLQTSGEYDIWLSDEWMKGWLELPAKLSDIDLRPYFYIAHDKIGPMDPNQTRLSLRAQEVLNQLLAPGSTSQALGVKEGAKLSQPDATSVFEALADRIRQAETLTKSPVKQAMFEFVGAQQHLIPQLISLFRSLPETKIPVEVIPNLRTIVKGTSHTGALLTLLNDWGRSTAKKSLADLANQAIQEMTKENLQG